MPERLDDDLFEGRISLDNSRLVRQQARDEDDPEPEPVWGPPLPCIVDSPAQTTQREIERANGEGSIYNFRLQRDVVTARVGDLRAAVARDSRIRLHLDPDAEPDEENTLILNAVGSPVIDPQWQVWTISAKLSN